MNMHKHKSQSNNKTNNNNQLKPKPSPKTNPAFTIIEVVLVLAIAGLIFLMVFIALPALQRNQRDAQRKRDIDRLASALINYKSNNRNKDLSLSNYNGDDKNFVDSYLKVGGDNFSDPDGTEYKFGKNGDYVGNGITVNNFDHTIYIVRRTKCDGEVAKWSGNISDYNYSILYKLEAGGVYCASGVGLRVDMYDPNEPM